MRELDPIRRLAPPVEPLAPGEVARIRARALAPRRRRLRVPGLLAPVAVAAAVVAFVVVLGSGQDREVSAPAGSAHAQQTGVPLRLEGGWRVSRVDGGTAERGQAAFWRDGVTVGLVWLPATAAGPDVDPAKQQGARRELEFGTSGGDRGAVWLPADGSGDIAVWRDGDTTVTAEGPILRGAALAGAVQSLRDAGIDEWRRGLPARPVTLVNDAGVVEGMLKGLPLPPGLDDVETLAARVKADDRYQLGAQIAGAVVCGWIAEWADGKAAGDEVRIRRATDALATSRDWPILREMNRQGDYPEVVWQYADAVAGDGTVVGGKTLTVEESYKAALCP